MSQKFRDMKIGLVKMNDKPETIQNEKHGNMFVIDKTMPEPLRHVQYEVLLGIIETLRQLNPGESFQISKELTYPVTKMRNLYFPDYKIRILQAGDSYRVFRRA